MKEIKPEPVDKIYRTETGPYVVIHGQGFQDELAKGMREDAGKGLQDFDVEIGSKTEMRVIETEDQVKELLAEIEEIQDPKLRKLAAQKAMSEALSKADKVWKTLTRERKRFLRNEKLKFSTRTKAALKSADVKRKLDAKKITHQRREGSFE